MTRNRFKNDQGTLWMTIPVWKKGLGLQKINDVRICREGRWAKKHLESLKTAYAHAPYFEDHLNFCEEIFSEAPEKLVDLNSKVIKHLTKLLGIAAEVLFLSELGIDTKEPWLSVEVCRKLGATHFLAQSGAKKYIDKNVFRKAGIEVLFFNFRPPVYPQLWGPFIANLSVFDLIFNCGPKARNIIAESSTNHVQN